MDLYGEASVRNLRYATLLTLEERAIACGRLSTYGCQLAAGQTVGGES